MNLLLVLILVLPVAPSRPCTIRGGPANNVIRGTSGDDVICAGRGDDFVDGRGGNDDIRGGSGTDTLVGGEGRDLIHGMRGNDRLFGTDSRGGDALDGDLGSSDRCFTDRGDQRTSCSRTGAREAKHG